MQLENREKKINQHGPYPASHLHGLFLGDAVGFTRRNPLANNMTLSQFESKECLSHSSALGVSAPQTALTK